MQLGQYYSRYGRGADIAILVPVGNTVHNRSNFMSCELKIDSSKRYARVGITLRTWPKLSCELTCGAAVWQRCGDAGDTGARVGILRGTPAGRRVLCQGHRPGDAGQ